MQNVDINILESLVSQKKTRNHGKQNDINDIIDIRGTTISSQSQKNKKCDRF